ncbi:MAG: F0F1 ATP synthase subunit B [Sulfurovaceae bacterium]|nr:F0F1 ATP synthase subunit B [Sulfurovaceae bacterium]
MKLNKMALAIAFVFPVIAMASGAGHDELTMSNSDFWYRVLNFSIFAGLLYYLLANPVKVFFKGRQEGIAKSFKEIEEKLNASKEAAKVAEENLVASQAKADELKKDSVSEGTILAENIANKNADTLVSLEKQSVEKMEHESKKMAKNAVDTILKDAITSDDIAIDESKVVSLISKKVA